MALVLVVFSACAEQRPPLDEEPRDSAAPALWEARRREFLEKQAAELALRAEDSRRLREPVNVKRATVVLFYPGLGRPADSGPIRVLVNAAADTARAAGWDVAERLGARLEVIDSSARASYKSPVARDSVGAVLVVPGYPPRVSYGLRALMELGTRLRALQAWLREQAGSTEART